MAEELKIAEWQLFFIRQRAIWQCTPVYAECGCRTSRLRNVGDEFLRKNRSKQVMIEKCADLARSWAKNKPVL